MEVKWQLVIFGCFGLCVLPAATSAKMCWDTTWYNSSHPSNESGKHGDIEKPPSHEVFANLTTNLCKNGATLEARCKDEKGEPFKGNKTSAGLFTTTCDVKSGIVCTPNTSLVCPDLAINFGCECPPTTTPAVSMTQASSGKTAAPDAASKASTTNGSGTGTTPHSGSGGSPGNGVASVAISPGVLGICYFLFVIYS